MRAAADLEDSMDKHIVTPAPMLPARELLGEMLLALKQPAEALAAFEASAKREPNRLRGTSGAAEAAALAGERAKAALYDRRLAALVGEAAAARRP
jgi:predicted Zn-dependent protease